jgi:Aminoglycoside-2''-adenylyltransferase
MGRVVTGKSADEILHLIGDFFMKKDDVHETMQRVTARLDEEGIPYALIGGMGIGLHGYVRVTKDVDLLTTPEGLARIHERLVGRGYVPAFSGARKRLRDTKTGILVDLITSGEYPGDGREKAVRYPDPSDSVERDGYRVLSLPRIIETKIITGTTVDYRQLQDLGDVQAIIRELALPKSFREQLDPSVRAEFDRLWDLAQKRDPHYDG